MELCTVTSAQPDKHVVRSHRGRQDDRVHANNVQMRKEKKRKVAM